MRLFVALPIPETAWGTFADIQARLPIGRLVPEENLHLTLSFLGDRTEDEAEAIDDVLSGLKADEVALELSGPVAFGGKSGQAIGLSADGGAALRELQARIQSRLTGAGLKMERRRFRPHVTLARLKGRLDPGPALDSLIGQHVGPVQCTAFGLFVSQLSPDGARYEALALYPLGLR